MQTISGKIIAGGGISGTVKTAEQVAVTELIFSSRFGFPNIGRADRLYIATDENAAYTFDASRNIYVRLNDFDTIQSRLREE
ncbi:MAG: hypothetical protein ACI4JB_07200 [Porcipelethomonas sp.]